MYIHILYVFFLRGYFWIGQFFGYTKDEYICELWQQQTV